MYSPVVLLLEKICKLREKTTKINPRTLYYAMNPIRSIGAPTRFKYLLPMAPRRVSNQRRLNFIFYKTKILF